MSPTTGARPTSRIVAITGSLVVVLLLIAVALGIGTGGVYRVRMLRLTPATVAVALLPVPAVAWIVALWKEPPSSRRANLFRVIITLVLIATAVVCATLTLLVLFLEPVPRGQVP